MSKEHVNQHVIISEIAKEREDVTRRTVAEIYEAIINKVEKYLDEGKDVEFTRFAKFELVDLNAKTARNPQTGGTVEVPAKRVVKVRKRKRLHDLTKAL